jgi:hypothetical protein
MDKHWKKEEIETFFDTCFSYFYWRSLGLLGAFVYELGQKQENLRNLEWDAIDESLSTVVVGRLSLPISGNLRTMLEQHKEEFDFQKYLFPYYRRHDNAYRPLNKKLVEYHLREVRQKAGLDPALNLNGLRWTSLLQMYKDGVSRYELMCLTGIDEGPKLDKALGQDPEAAYEAVMKRSGLIKLTLQGN